MWRIPGNIQYHFVTLHEPYTVNMFLFYSRVCLTILHWDGKMYVFLTAILYADGAMVWINCSLHSHSHWRIFLFFFFFLSIYPTALGLSCSLTDFPVIFIVARGIFSCGTRMISCSMWDLIRDQLPGSLYLEPWVLATGPPGESQQIFLSSLDSQPWWMIIVLSFPGWLFRSAGSQDWSCQCLRADSPPCLGYLESCLPSACCLSPAVKVLAAVGPPSSPRCSSHLLWT